MVRTVRSVALRLPAALRTRYSQADWLAWFRQAWPVLVILLLPVVLLSPSLFGGHAVTASDILLQYSPWSVDLARQSGSPRNSLLFDDPFEITPWLSFTRSELLAGRFPLWDSYAAGGMPFFAAGQPAVLYPLTLLAALFPYPMGLTVAGLLKWWLVGLGMYVFARSSLRLGQAAALVAALSYMFSSFVVVWLIHPVGQAAILLPWVFWASERVIQQPTRGRLALLAVLVALVGYSGHPEMSFHVLFGACLYVLWLLGTRRETSWIARLRLLVVWSGGMLLGICLAAVQLLPVALLIPHSLSASMRSQDYGGIVVPLQGIATWLVPNFWGNPALIHDYWGPRNYNEEVWYAGAVALVLAGVAVLALRRRERRSDVLFFGLLALCFAALLYRIPPFIWLTHLPVLRVDSWTRLGLLAIVGVSALAGLGFEEVLTWGKAALAAGNGSQTRKLTRHFGNRRALLGLGVLVALLPVILWAIGRFWRPPHLNPDQVAWEVLWIRIAALFVWGAAVLLLLLRRRWLSRRVVGGALLALILGDQLLFVVPYVPQPSASLAFPETPTLTRLQQTIGPARMAANGSILAPDSTTAYHLHDLRAYDITASSRYLHFMLKLDPGLGETIATCCQFLGCPSPVLLSVASVDYYATLSNEDANACAERQPGKPLAAGPFVPLWTQGGITLWRNTQARPRFYFANQVIPSKGENQTLSEIALISQSGREAIIEGATSVPLQSADQGVITVEKDLPGEITVRTEADGGHWLIVDESYDSGWQAEVDGVSTTIHPANEMFQAVWVQAGVHTIHLSYCPVGFSLGVLISVLSLFALLSLLPGEWVLRRFIRK